jgi:hypothetical protein
MRAPVRDGDGSAVCARDGGLVLPARPKTLNPKPCEPFPVGRGPRAASARRRSTVRRRSTRTSACGTPRRSPRCTRYAPLPARLARTMADALGRGFDAARPVVRGGTADARARAHTCKHSLAPSLGCRYGRPEGRLDTCIRRHIYIHVCVRLCVTRVYVRYPFICIT